MTRLYPISVVASLLEVPIEVIERAVELGDLPIVRIQGRQRIEAAAIEDFIKRRRMLGSYKNAPAPLGFTWSATTFVVTFRDAEVVLVDSVGRSRVFEAGVAKC